MSIGISTIVKTVLFFTVCALLFLNEEVLIVYNKAIKMAQSQSDEGVAEPTIPTIPTVPTDPPVPPVDHGFNVRSLDYVRPPTLVIYVYSETNSLKRGNLEYFLAHGMCENCTNVDFVFIINGATDVKFPKHSNVELMNRENVCGDIGGWDYYFTKASPEKVKKYKRIMFVNDTVRGPYIDPNYYFMFKNLHFTDIFGMYLTNETRLVGSYINCGDVYGGAGVSHVQTMSIMMDDVALELARPLMKCYTDKIEAVVKAEIGISQKVLENNYNIACLLYAYRGVDFRKDTHIKTTCNNNADPTIDGHYFGYTPNPMEVVFFKNTRGNNQLPLDLYSSWAGREDYHV